MIKLRLDRLPVTSDIVRWLKVLVIGIILTMAIGAFFSFWAEASRLAAGLVVLFFLPGLCFSYLIIGPNEGSWLLRWTLAPILSLAAEPVAFFFASRFGLPISTWAAIGLAIILAVIGTALSEWRWAKKFPPALSSLD